MIKNNKGERWFSVVYTAGSLNWILRIFNTKTGTALFRTQFPSLEIRQKSLILSYATVGRQGLETMKKAGYYDAYESRCMEYKK
jgi:hypothetical protein